MDRVAGTPLYSISGYKIPGDLRPTYDWASQIFTGSDKEQVRVGVYGWSLEENTWHWDKFSLPVGTCPQIRVCCISRRV